MDSEKQKDEITALESIYNEEEFSYHEENGLYKCTFKISINLPMGYYFTYSDNRLLEEPTEKVQISHLPPLLLHVILPENYPSTSSPKFTLCSSWLCQSPLSKLCRKLDELWEESKGQEILFIWIGFLQDQTLQFLNIETNLNINCDYTTYKIAMEKVLSPQKHKEELDTKQLPTIENSQDTTDTCSISELHKERYKDKIHKSIDERAISYYAFGRNPVEFLIDYNEECNDIEFNKSLYTCKICFANKLGEHCMKFLSCSHVFCKDCITGYMEFNIKNGKVQSISCPEEKCTSEATPGQVKELVSAEMFAKYDSILLNITLDTMTDIVYCPRRHCQYPVSRDVNEQVATCPACGYAFCVYCKMLYHGIEPCKVNSAEKQHLMNEYRDASDDKKLKMEQRYGKRQLQTMLENMMSEIWITENSHYCPHCNAAIEKSDGCNKMTCSKCKTYFCWLCGKKLSKEDPYYHFHNPKSECFDRLYNGLIPNEEDEEDDLELHAMYMDYLYEDFDIDY